MTAALAILLAGCVHTPRAELAHDAALLTTLGAHYHIPPALGAAMEVRESTCRRRARSRHGDLGLMQIRRGCATRGFDGLTDEQLMEPRVNLKLGLRRLALARRRCGGAPWEETLGAYAGLRGCRASAYGARVIATMEGRP